MTHENDNSNSTESADKSDSTDKADSRDIVKADPVESGPGPTNKNQQRSSRQTTAYILLGIAAFIILSNTGWLSLLGIFDLIGGLISLAFNLMPAGLLALGLWWIHKSDSGQRPFAAWFLVVFGGSLVVAQFGLFGLSFGSLFFPLILVLVALALLNPGGILPQSGRFGAWPGGDKSDNYNIRLFAFMGGGEIRYSSQTLKSGEVGAFMGGYQLDLTDADMDGDQMVLDLFCIMGGCEIRIPPNWEVEKQAVAIMGGYSITSRCLAEKLELPRKKLIIRGLVFMGGGEVKN